MSGRTSETLPEQMSQGHTALDAIDGTSSQIGCVIALTLPSTAVGSYPSQVDRIHEGHAKVPETVLFKAKEAITKPFQHGKQHEETTQPLLMENAKHEEARRSQESGLSGETEVPPGFY